jgi:hypothetical protein
MLAVKIQILFQPWRVASGFIFMKPLQGLKSGIGIIASIDEIPPGLVNSGEL